MKKPTLPKTLLVLLVAPAFLALVLPASRLMAQSQTETKIRLMADGLRARDNGDFETAKKDFEELLALAPNDATVQRLLGGVNSAIEAKAAAAASTQVAVTPVAAPAAPVASSEPVEVTFPNPNKPEAIKSEPAKPVLTPEEVAVAQADVLAKQENERIKGLIKQADAKRSEARRMAKDGRFDDAAGTLAAAIKLLPVNALTKDTLADLEAEKNALLLEKAQYLLKQGDTDGARVALEAYAQATNDTKKVQSVSKSIAKVELNPPLQPIEKVDPKFIESQKEIARLVAKGRSQYLAADVDGAKQTFSLIESIDASNPEAKSFLARIANEKSAVGVLNRAKTRAQLMEEVANSWSRPNVYIDHDQPVVDPRNLLPLAQKLNSILIPNVNFAGVELSKVVSTLTAISQEYDKSDSVNKGVNIVLIDQSNKNPTVNITLRDLSLKRILDFIVEATGYQYEIQADAIVVRPGGETNTLETAFFPVTRATVIRMTGVSSAASASPAAAADPFAAAPAAAGGGGGGGEASGLRAFLQQAGVDFEGTAKSSLAYDGASIIVTQSSRNIERIRNILNRYNDVKQVEIEAKFMDVQDGALDELGVSWTAAGHGVPQFNTTTGAPIIGSNGQQVNVYNQNYSSNYRTLANAFSSNSSAGSGSIVQQSNNLTTSTVAGVTTTTSSPGPATSTPIVNNAPGLPGSANLGAGAAALAVITGTIGEFNVSAMLRAISQKTGTDLLSAPKVTVLSGNAATITVAQEMRYPQSYGEIQSQVGSSGGNNGGGAQVLPSLPALPKSSRPAMWVLNSR